MDLNLSPDSAVLSTITGKGNIQIPVRVHGENQSKMPVLMMHGLESHSGWFWQSGEFLAESGYPTYIIDRRGSGRSTEPRGDCRNYRDMLDDIQSVADYAREKHQSERFLLFGHCFGAIPSVIYAMQHPDQLNALVLSTPAIFTLADLHIEEKLHVFGSRITGKKVMIPTPIEDPKMFTRDQHYLEFIHNDTLKLKEATASLFWQVLRSRIYINKHRKQLTVPMLMATAGMDEICDNKKNIDFYNHIGSKNKTHLSYPEAVHIFEFSPEKDKYFGDLKNWLATVN